MNKENFLKNLRKELTILNVEEVEDIIQEYESHIDEHLSNGLTEEEAIMEFGDFDQLVEGILEAYNIDSDYASSYRKRVHQKEKMNNFVNKSSSTLGDLVEGFIDFINVVSKNIYQYFENSSFARISMTLFLVLIFAIAIERVEVLVLGFVIVLVVHQANKVNGSKKETTIDTDGGLTNDEAVNEEGNKSIKSKKLEKKDSNTGMYAVKTILVAFLLIIFVPLMMILFFGSFSIAVGLIILIVVLIKTKLMLLVSFIIALIGLLIIFLTTFQLIITTLKAVNSKWKNI